MKLYVGNLPYQANEEQLQAWFTEAGINVSNVNLVRDRFSGEPRGFGFVEIADDGEGTRAITALNGKPFLGRTLVVNQARPQTDRPRGESGRGGHGPRGSRD